MQPPSRDERKLLAAAEGIAAGSSVARYRVVEQVGAGGMAVVFRARDKRLNRQVALKVLAPALAADKEFRQRFIRESRAAAAVDDPHIIPIYEAGEADGILFIAMRYVSGGDVWTLVHQRGRLPIAQALSIISPVASALDAAHAAGLVHRDVKPANMLLDVRPGRPDHVYLTDFGLSKGVLSSVGLTGTGQVLGTPDYISPEQIADGAIDGRADQYALACAAFELLSGTPPFQRDHDIAVMYAHSAESPPELTSRSPGLPKAVDAVLAKALAKDPVHRYANCQDFTESLRAALRLSPNHSQPGAIHPKDARPSAVAVLGSSEANAHSRVPLAAEVPISSDVTVGSVQQWAAPLDAEPPRQLQHAAAANALLIVAHSHAGRPSVRRHRSADGRKSWKTWSAAVAAIFAAGTLIWHIALPRHANKPIAQPNQPSYAATRRAGGTRPAPIEPRIYSGGGYREILAMTIGGGHLWVTQEARRGGFSVAELDASNGRFIWSVSGRRYRFNSPQAIAVSDSHVWVVNTGVASRVPDPSLTELDATSGRLIRILPGANYGFDGPVQVAVDGGHLWVTNNIDNSVTELNADNGRLVKILSGGNYGFNQPWGIGISGGHVWVANNGMPSSVTEINAKSGRWIRTLSARHYRFSASADIAVGAGHIWITNNGRTGGTVTELDASDGRLVQILSGGSDHFTSVGGIVVDDSHVWLTMMSDSYPSGSVTEFDASNGSQIRTLSGNGFNSLGPIVTDHLHIWVISSGVVGVNPGSLTEFPAR